MKCPLCDHDGSSVVDSRVSKDGVAIRRRRECEQCKGRFTTYERIEELLPMVVKKDGRREGFDRQKLLQGLKKAVEKRPVPATAIDEMIARIEQRVQEYGENEVPSTYIGEAVMKQLREVDHIAYVRFASVYRSFKDIEEFMSELAGLSSAPPKKPV